MGFARRSGSRGDCLLLLSWFSFCIVLGQAPWPVEDGQSAIGVFMDPDAGLDVVMAVAIFGDLQHQGEIGRAHV